MTELQEKLLKMLLWFHNFCVRNGLRYYMLGGTAIGAARHKGFIPWDDDIDIGMPRADYERLEQLMEAEPTGQYVLETPRTEAEDYFYPFSKVYDTTTTLVENTRAQIKRGIYLDVFPLDGIGNSEKESRRNYRGIYWKYNLLLTRVTGIRAGRNWLKNTAVRISGLIPKWLLDNKRLLHSLERDCRKRVFDRCSWVGNLVGAWNFRELLPKEYFGEPKLYEFEGHMLYGPQQMDAYLTNLYGDWRKLPPEDKRVSHHDFVELDLNRAYLRGQ